MFRKSHGALLGSAMTAFVSSPAFAQASPAPCTSLEDLYQPDGCSIVSSRTYTDPETGTESTPGHLTVHAYVGADGVRSPDLALVGGGFDLKVPGTASVTPLGALGTIPQEARQALDDANVDIVYFDFAQDNDNFAQAKSYVLQDSLRQINDWRSAAGEDNEMIYIGLSLGGVVGRHALRSLELEGYDHRVRTMFTWDSPHLGANVPLSLQWMVRDLAGGPGILASRMRTSFLGLGYLLFRDQWEALDAFSSEVWAIVNGMIRTPASRQLIINYFIGSEVAMDPYGVQLHAELGELGMPQLTHNVAVAAGGIYQDPSRNERKPKYFDFDGSLDGLTMSFDVWRDDTDPFEQSFMDVGVVSEYETSRSRDGSLDTVPCSTISLPGVFTDFLFDELESRGFAFTNMHNYQDDPSFYDSESCFVPTLSSLGIDSLDIQTRSLPTLEELQALSPFDELYAGHQADFDHNSTDYWVFQDSFEGHLRSTYGEPTPEDIKADAGLPCTPEDGSGGWGGFGFHNGSVTNTNSTPVDGWEVYINFGEGVEPAPAWSWGASYEIVSGNYVRVFGSEVLQPGQNHFFGLGGNYTGPQNISLSCF